MRNYKKEALWQKQKYDDIRVKVQKDIGINFRNKLKEENIKVTDFFKSVIENYLNEK